MAGPEPSEDLGDTGAPIVPPFDREAAHFHMRRQMTWITLVLALVSVLAEIAAAIASASTSVQVTVTGVAGIFIGLWISTWKEWFS
jgi:hypothetical protein